MKQVIRKWFIDYEKEEKWLNELSAKGLALTDYSWCRYVLEETEPSKYIYRIELLENHATHPESVAYIRFMEETGAECVTTYQRWVYFRKKAVDGEFDIYSDLQSKLKHFQRIRKFWLTLTLLELIIGLFNVGIGGINFALHTFMSGVNVGLGLALCCLSLLFYTCLYLPVKKKIKKMKQEQLIRE